MKNNINVVFKQTIIQAAPRFYLDKELVFVI